MSKFFTNKMIAMFIVGFLGTLGAIIVAVLTRDGATVAAIILGTVTPIVALADGATNGNDSK